MTTLSTIPLSHKRSKRGAVHGMVIGYSHGDWAGDPDSSMCRVQRLLELTNIFNEFVDLGHYSTSRYCSGCGKQTEALLTAAKQILKNLTGTVI